MISSSVRRATEVAALVACVAISACAKKEPEVPVGTSHRPHAAEVREKVGPWAFDSLDERPVSAQATRGKPTVLAFVTTDTIQSQAQVGFLRAMHKTDGDRVNYAIVAVQPSRDRELVEMYRRSLEIAFPVAAATPDVVEAGGPFGEIGGAPTIIVLDREGNLAWKHTGVAKADEIRAHLGGL